MAPVTERPEGKRSTSSAGASRRRLMVRDGLMFVSLTAVALVMAAVTTLLFRSFEAHRESLAADAAARGRLALQQRRYAEAVEDFRSALEFRRGNREDQLALARALAADGRVDQAESYFLNLWQAQPGDGSINLELARVKRKQGKALDAIQYYRAAVFGTWTGDAPRRRRDIRLELASYLIERGQPRAARAELLIASGNNPDAETQLRIAELLEQAGDATDALVDYRNATSDPKTAATAFRRIGALCYSMGDYACAESAFGKAAEQRGIPPDDKRQSIAAKENAARLQEMSLSMDLPAQERVKHLLADSRIVQARLNQCASRQTASPVGDLQATWRQLDTPKNRSALHHDDTLQGQFRQQIFTTELQLDQACGAATGDDALLLYLQAHPLSHAGVQP